MSTPVQAFSVATFCASHNISRSLFYEILAAGEGPRCMLVRGRRLISAEAAKEWREARTDVTSTAAESDE